MISANQTLGRSCVCPSRTQPRSKTSCPATIVAATTPESSASRASAGGAARMHRSPGWPGAIVRGEPGDPPTRRTSSTPLAPRRTRRHPALRRRRWSCGPRHASPSMDRRAPKGMSVDSATGTDGPAQRGDPPQFVMFGGGDIVEILVAALGDEVGLRHHGDPEVGECRQRCRRAPRPRARCGPAGDGRPIAVRTA